MTKAPSPTEKSKNNVKGAHSEKYLAHMPVKTFIRHKTRFI